MYYGSNIKIKRKKRFEKITNHELKVAREFGTGREGVRKWSQGGSELGREGILKGIQNKICSI
jgi:hypothetical protein